MYTKNANRIRGRTLWIAAAATIALGFAACAGDQHESAAPEQPADVMEQATLVPVPALEAKAAESAAQDGAITGQPVDPLALYRDVDEDDLAPESTQLVEVPAEVFPEVQAKVNPVPAMAKGASQDLPIAAIPEETHQAPAMEAKGQLGVLTQLDNALSKTRWASNPTPWDRGRIGRYETSFDREADRAKSLQARAKLRSFEGAPPVMPHSLSYIAGGKECLDCHYTGLQIGKKVAHPMSHVTMANCTQCHVEQTNKLFDEVIVPGNNFDGDRPIREGVSSMAGAPPMIPHTTLMRTACLSCHGEFGYLGLKTDHPERSNCMQCHIVEK
jgi:nitrate reductase cytochrome c-type subunit